MSSVLRFQASEAGSLPKGGSDVGVFRSELQALTIAFPDCRLPARDDAAFDRQAVTN